MEFSQKLKNARELKNLSVDDLAEKMSVSRQTVYDWESGKSEPRKAKLDKLKQILGMDYEHHTQNFNLTAKTGEEMRLIPRDVWEELQDNNTVFKEEIDRLWNLVNTLAGQSARPNKA